MPPPRFERAALRWLLRAALLGTVGFAVWGTFFERGGGRYEREEGAAEAKQDDEGVLRGGEDVAPPFDATGPVSGGGAVESASGVGAVEALSGAGAVESGVEAGERGNALVVVSQHGDDVTWLEGVLPGWERNVYVVDGEALQEGARLGIPRNKGREGMVYLRWVSMLAAAAAAAAFWREVGSRMGEHNADPHS